MTQKVPTKSASISVRFRRGVPKRLTNAAAHHVNADLEPEPMLRAAWIRRLVLQRVEYVLAPVLAPGRRALLPLSFATADGHGEGILLRFRPTELKRVEQAAKKEGALLSSYIRAICMLEIDGPTPAITVPNGANVEITLEGDAKLEPGAIHVESGGSVTIKTRAKVDPMYVEGATRAYRRGKKHRERLGGA